MGLMSTTNRPAAKFSTVSGSPLSSIAPSSGVAGRWYAEAAGVKVCIDWTACGLGAWSADLGSGRMDYQGPLPGGWAQQLQAVAS